MTVTYANAAHVPLLHFRGGRFESIHADGPLLGGSAAAWGSDTLRERTLTFQVRPGETLVATTDGLFEQTNGKRQMFETAILPELDLSSCTSAQGMVTAILQTLRGFRGEAPLDDDLLLLAIRVV